MMMDPERRSQVEDALGRPLMDEELVVVDDLAALPPSHFAVVEQLHMREPFAALRYLRAVIRDDDLSAQRQYVLGFDRLLAKRDNRPALPAQQFYESELGRSLTADETVKATSLQSITRVQRDVARALAVKDSDVALTYLAALVPSSSWQDRQAFLESLPRAE